MTLDSSLGMTECTSVDKTAILLDCMLFWRKYSLGLLQNRCLVTSTFTYYIGNRECVLSVTKYGADLFGVTVTASVTETLHTYTTASERTSRSAPMTTPVPHVSLRILSSRRTAPQWPQHRHKQKKTPEIGRRKPSKSRNRDIPKMPPSDFTIWNDQQGYREGLLLYPAEISL